MNIVIAKRNLTALGRFALALRKIIVTGCFWILINNLEAKPLSVWETFEIKLETSGLYANPYKDIELWVQLRGPGFDKKVYGFWDGDNTFKVRLMATKPGKWSWESFSKPFDDGLAGKKGSFIARSATKEEIKKNSNLRGVIRTNPEAPHGFIYADGSPFFLLADTWWAAATWRYPFKKGVIVPDNYIPEEQNWSFEGGIHWMKAHGYNSIALLSCFPNWRVDDYGTVVEDNNGVTIRSATTWGKAPMAEKIKDMHDENGNMPFMFPGKCIGKENVCADYDRINPMYWQSLDKKMVYLWHQGFVPYMETIRRDQLPVWITYHNFNESFARFLNYLKARYGTYNFIYSLVHFDGDQQGLTVDNLREAFLFYHNKYGGMPFGQPVTAMMKESTLKYLGNPDTAIYLTCHSGGNSNREHGILKEIKAFYDSRPFAPGFNNEPYYPMLNFQWARSSGVKVEPNSELDNYFGRSHMYSNFFSGSFGGYVFGTGAFGGDSYGEPVYLKEPERWPKIWDALKIDAWRQGLWYKKFVNSLGNSYQSLIPARDFLSDPGNDTEALTDWTYLLKSNDNRTVLLYFERNAKKQIISKLIPGTKYSGSWYNPRTGDWAPFSNPAITNETGTLQMPLFPGNLNIASDDWVAKLIVQ